MSAADFTPERLAELRGFDWGRVVVIDGRDSDTGELYRAVKYVVADVEVRSMLDAIEELQAANTAHLQTISELLPF